LVVRTWTASDSCGNVSVKTQTITRIDNAKPELIGVPSDVTLNTGDAEPVFVVKATDDCDDNVKLTSDKKTETLACTEVTTYTWTATDACGNTATASAKVTKKVSNGGTITDNIDVVTKADNCNTKSGSVNMGPAKYTYTWADGFVGAARGSLAAGDYVVTVSDACLSKVITVKIASDCPCTKPTLTDQKVVDASCTANDGSITLTVTGNVADYNFAWSPAITSTTNTATGLAAGDYKLVISRKADPNCTADFNFTVKKANCPCVTPVLDDKKITDASCGKTNGAIELTMNGGNTEYNFAWTPAASTTASATNLAAGDYKIVVSRKADPSCTTTFTYNVKAVGDLGLFAATTDSRDLADCAGYADYCMPITIADITAAKYDITDNGTAYTAGFKGCDFDSSFSYNTSIVPVAATYEVTKWTVNGKDYTATYTNLADLATKMNTWDATGNWKASTDGNIVGGDRTKFYGTLEIKAGTQSSKLDLNTQLIPQGVALKLAKGTHAIKVTNKATGCSDEITITVTCTPPPVTCKSFIADRSLFLSTVCGTPAKLDVEIPFATIGDYTITDLNVPYTGTKAATTKGTSLELPQGIHTLVFKSKDGCRDTVDVKVYCVTARIIKDTVYVSQLDTICLDIAELVGNIKDIKNIWPSKSGEHAIFAKVPNSRCITCLGVEAGGTDEAAYVITDDKGISDTTFFQITVIAKVQSLNPPKALTDIVKTKPNKAVEIDVMANDTLKSLLTKLEIVENPKFGTVEILANGRIIYTPLKDYCDDNAADEFTYNICTNGGCSTASVLVNVTCNDIVVYTGFSPNGDNVNDNFTIEGIQNYPDNRVTVFNRQGIVVFDKEGYRNDWNGTWNNKNLPDGTYFYMFEDGKGEKKVGYVQIRR
jgi:gliding motility-associated-like protein